MHTRNMTDVVDGYNDPKAGGKTNKVAAARINTTGLQEQYTSNEDYSDNKEGVETGEISVAEPDPTKLVSIVMDMSKTLFGSGRIFNMENYCTSPEVVVALMKEDVFMRGTFRANRRGFLQGVIYARTEANRLGQGSIHMMVDATNGLVAFGWVDRNPVHFLTSVDGTKTSNVTHRFGKDNHQVQAPTSIKVYNRGMQAVDRHDQLQERFPLLHGYGFKKYYMKIALRLIYMAAVNYWISYKLVNVETRKEKFAWYNFFDSLADDLMDSHFQAYVQFNRHKNNEYAFNSLCSTQTRTK